MNSNKINSCPPDCKNSRLCTEHSEKRHQTHACKSVRAQIRWENFWQWSKCTRKWKIELREKKVQAYPGLWYPHSQRPRVGEIKKEVEYIILEEISQNEKQELQTPQITSMKITLAYPPNCEIYNSGEKKHQIPEKERKNGAIPPNS